MDNGSFLFAIILVLSPLILVLAIAAYAVISGIVFLVGSGITIVVSRVISGRQEVDASDLVDDGHADQILNA